MFCLSDQENVLSNVFDRLNIKVFSRCK